MRVVARALKNWFGSSKIYNFNVVERDRWIADQACSIPPGSLVLDIGAGSCPYAKYFAHCTYKTSDFQQLTREQIRGRIGYGRIDYVCDATQIPVEDGSFDVVLCTEVLEHVSEPIKVIRECGRILRPGGKLILTAPLGSGIHQAPYHFYGGYTPYWYREFLCRFGFEDVVISANGGFFKQYGQESVRFARESMPWRHTNSLVLQVALTPIWLASLVWFALLCPSLAHVMDRLDKKKDFTVGYHVLGTKKGL